MWSWLVGIWVLIPPMLAGLFLRVHEEVELPVDYDLEMQWLLS